MGRRLYLPTLPSLLSSPGQPFIHRDMSWLLFNERVLDEARASGNPLMERAKFLSITASNLDEFFMIRFSSLGRSIAAAAQKDPAHRRHLIRIRSAILEAVNKFSAKQAETLDLISAEFEGHGVFFVNGTGAGDAFADAGKRIFSERILPRLGAPEPFSFSWFKTLGNFQVAAIFGNKFWIHIPPDIPRIFVAEGPSRGQQVLFFLDGLLKDHLGEALRLGSRPGLIRLTRDADVTVDLPEEDTTAIPDVVRSTIRTREKGRPVRVEYCGEIADGFLRRTATVLRLSPGQLVDDTATLFLSSLWTATAEMAPPLSGRKGLFYQGMNPCVRPDTADPGAVFARLDRQDILFHHPYDSFDGFVNWVRAACGDSAVESIKLTVYRMDAVSPVVAALKEAARRKKIQVIIELRARFDEMNNLKVAEELREAGAEVGFGMGKLKLHAKLALVTRRTDAGIRYYTHLSTGNYNAKTARLYEDLAILTANQEIGEDVRHFFDSIWNAHVPSTFKHLLPAPTGLHKRLMKLIDEETQAARAGGKARIIAKVNALVDKRVIEKLYEASQAGVRVDLIVRGACSVIPGVKGLSERIQVLSVVDRFLEHSRIYYFENAKRIYLSSADWMPRNFFSRLEIAFPVLDPAIYKYIETIVLPSYLVDTAKGKELAPQGTWKKRTVASMRLLTRRQPLPPHAEHPVRVQFYLEDLRKKQEPIGVTPAETSAVAV